LINSKDLFQGIKTYLVLFLSLKIIIKKIKPLASGQSLLKLELLSSLVHGLSINKLLLDKVASSSGESSFKKKKFQKAKNIK